MTDALFLLQISPALGPAGAILLFAIAGFEFVVGVALTIVVVRQRSWKTIIDNTESANQAAVTEMNVHKEAASRLSGENRSLIKENERLKAQTDLAPLNKTLHDWVAEGRLRFESASKRLDEIHTQQGIALTSILEELKAQRITSEASTRAIVETMREQSTALQTHVMEDRQYQLRFLNILDSLERRTSDIAVKIGMSKWSEPEKPAVPS